MAKNNNSCALPLAGFWVSLNLALAFTCRCGASDIFKNVSYTSDKMTSHICGHNTIIILWGKTVVLCVVKW